MGQSGEIITFQIGTYANFVGGHFFNLQDPLIHPEYESSFNSRTLWREGQDGQRRKVVTPRVLIFDLKDKWSDTFVNESGDKSSLAGDAVSVGQAAKSPNVLSKIEKEISWDGKVQRVVLPKNDSSDSEEESESEPVSGPLRKGKSRKPDKKVKLGQFDYSNWGDFTKWRVHDIDKAGFRIPSFMFNAETDSLVSYGQGLDVFRRLEESVTDGIRKYAEDCDYLEGFQMLVDEYDGFAGISGGILEHLGDEYDKKACLGLGLNRPLPEKNDQSQSAVMKEYKLRISNTVQLWSAFSRHSRVFSSFGVSEDVFCLNPVARKFPGIIQDCSIPSVSSAILAATLESLTAPYRTLTPSFPLHEMTSLLNAFGHKMALIGSSMPYPLNKRTLFAALNEDGFSSLTSLTPNVDLDLDKSIGNVFVMRGFRQDQVISKSDSREFKHVDLKTVTACTELYCQESYSKSVHVIKDIPTPFKLAHPYPNLYDPTYLDLHSEGRKFNFSQGDSWNLPTLASAHNTPTIGTILDRIVSITGGGVGGSSMKMKTFYAPSSETCNSVTIEFEDYAECVDDLCTLKDTYTKD